MYNIKRKIAVCLLLILSQTSFSVAEVRRKTPSIDGGSAGPYYNPASKSYFELILMPNVYGTQRWRHAKANAQKKIFKNTQGRLAIIKNLATHQFILRNFKSKNYWIGLQYFCNSKTLKWVDGSGVSGSDFTAWASKWFRLNDTCSSSRGYMPVSYSTNEWTNGITRWLATGPEKGFGMYLVEYPTGGE